MERLIVCYPLASDSDTDYDEEELILIEEELENDLVEETLVAEEITYTQSLNDIQSLMIFMIFFMGINAGLVFAKVMWGRVR